MTPALTTPQFTTHLLYLHGFRSSPQSTKARLVAEYVARHHPSITLWCPQLPPSPYAATVLLEQGTQEWPRKTMAVMGSSLGGYYAAWFAQQAGCPSVLLNPAYAPALDLEKYVGDQTQWHDPSEHFYFAPEFIAELQALDMREQPLAAPQMAVIAKGDEVLDWRGMVARYQAADITLLEGGDHALSDFAQHLPAVAQFLRLA